MSADVLYLVPPGYIRCYVTKSHRKDTPEENVRQRWARSLCDEYGYGISDMAVEFPIRMGSSKKRADIVVFKAGANHVQENIIIIVEAKRDDVLVQDRSDGVDQLKSYLAACVACRHGLWVGKERMAVLKESGDQFVTVADIPRFGDSKPRRPSRSDLVVAHDLASSFRRCHNYIHANGGFQKAEAFHEMLKLIFCKVLDEEDGDDLELSFAIDPREQRSESGKTRLKERIQPLFDSVKERFPHIFQSDDTIKLEPSVLAYIVAELQYVSLADTEMDIKGAAYEELVGANLRGDRGEYF